jgi:adenylate cyclase
MINNEALENMLEQILEAFTLKIVRFSRRSAPPFFMVDPEKEELWSKSPRVKWGKAS